MDSFTNTTTRIVSIVVMIVSIYLLYEILLNNNMLALGSLIFFHALFLFAYFSIPGKYTIKNNSLYIKSVLFKTTININTIEYAWVDNTNNSPLTRVIAFGGFFGYAGVFFNNTLGRVYVFGRRLSGDRLVLTLKNGKTYVLFPDEPYKMLVTLKDIGDNLA